MTTALMVALSVTTLVSVLWALRLRGSVQDLVRAATQRKEESTLPQVDAELDAPYRIAGSGVPDQERIRLLVSENAGLRQKLDAAQAALAAAKADLEKESANALAAAQADTAIRTMELQCSNAGQEAQAEVLRYELEKVRVEADIKESENHERARRWEQRRARLENDHRVLASLSPARIAKHFSALVVSLEQEQAQLEEQLARLEEERKAVDADEPDTELETLVQRNTLQVLNMQQQSCMDRLGEVRPDLESCRSIAQRATAMRDV